MRESRVRFVRNNPRIIDFKNDNNRSSKRAFSELKMIYEKELEYRIIFREKDNLNQQKRITKEERDRIKLKVKKQFEEKRIRELIVAILESILGLLILSLFIYFLFIR